MEQTITIEVNKDAARTLLERLLATRPEDDSPEHHLLRGLVEGFAYDQISSEIEGDRRAAEDRNYRRLAVARKRIEAGNV